MVGGLVNKCLCLWKVSHVLSLISLSWKVMETGRMSNGYWSLWWLTRCHCVWSVLLLEEYSIICPQRYALRVSHKVEWDISGETLVSMKTLICDEAWLTNCSSFRRRGLSLQLQVGLRQLGKVTWNETAPWSEIVTLVCTRGNIPQLSFV